MRLDGSPFAVLTVCSGNICRSPLAEQLLRARLDSSDHLFTVYSAGTIADDGARMEGNADELSRHYGGSPEAHRARRLRVDHIAKSHLVLTATRAHRATVVQLFPRASRFTFTLNEFARLLATASPDDRAAWCQPEDVVASVAAQRGAVVPPGDESEDDVVDPYQRGRAVHEQVAAVIETDVAAIASALGGLPPRDRTGT